MEQAIIAGNKSSQALRWSALITFAALLIAWPKNSMIALLLAAPFLLFTYLLYFSIGTAPRAAQLRQWCNGQLLRFLTLPLVLVALLYLYIFLTGGKPWQGNSWQIPLLFCAPVLFYRGVVGSGAKITWKDPIGAALCFLPYALHDYPFDSNLPMGGGGIEPLYLTLAIIVAVYSLVVVRQIPRIGFEPYLSLAAVKFVLTWWALLFTVVVAIGLPGGLLKWVGYEPVGVALLVGALAEFLRTLFGTALPEELLFRGVFLNLLHQRIAQSGNWGRYLYVAVLLLPLAAAAGYILQDGTSWFPLLIAALLWAMTLRFCRRDPAKAALYTAMFIVSTLFGLAHYHTHSTLFMGLAMLAGWVYGHVYHKTGSVFYAALTHTLVNTAPALFGLAIVR